MLKTVSSVANALGALNYKGTWDASTNTPTLASGIGTQGDYYVVSVAGATDLDGITNWGVGDWATFNGSVWQRVEGGADGNFVDLKVSNDVVVDNNLIVNNRIGVETSSPDELVHIYQPSGGDLALKIQSDPTAAYSSTRIKMKAGNLGVNEIYFGDASSDDIAKIRYEHSTNAMAFKVNNQEALRINSSGNLVVLSGNGIDFSATAGTGTSELLDDYEEGVYTPTLGNMSGGTVTYTTQTGIYTKVGRQVTVYFKIVVNTNTNTGGNTTVSVPFTAGTGGFVGPLGLNTSSNSAITHVSFFVGSANANFYTAGGGTLNGSAVVNGSKLQGSITYFV